MSTAPDHEPGISDPIRILLAEDTRQDEELLFYELRKGGLDFVSRCVADPGAFESALDEFGPHIVLTDFTIPAFGPKAGFRVLSMSRERLPDVPVVFVSGTIGEEQAVQALREGATDYVLKHNRARAVPVVRRALLEARERRARAQAERERDEMVRRFELFMRYLPGIAFMKDPEGRYTYINPAVEKALGRQADSLIGRTVHDLLPPEAAAISTAHHLAIMQTGQAQSGAIEFVTPAGPRTYITHCFPISDDATPQLVGGIAIDITDKEQAERALALSEERLRSIAEATREWIWESDQEGAYTFSSPAAEAITGYKAEELVGRRSVELVHSTARCSAERDLVEAVAEKRGWRDVVLRLQCRDGSLRWVDSNAFPLLDARGELIGFRGAARDVTERIEQQQRIARLSRIHAVLSEINSMIVRVHERAQLFSEACRIAVEDGGFALAWVGLADPASPHVRPVAWHGVEDGYLEAHGAAVAARCMFAEALSDCRLIVVNDMQADPRIAAFRDGALQRGYRAMAALPLLLEGAAAGVLLLYATEVNFFNADEVKLLGDLAADFSFALDHLAKEERLAYVAYYDTLTGLPNRQLYFERLTQLTLAAKGDETIAVLVIDIDRFSYFNDSIGRSAGDQLLIEVARRLRQTFSKSTVPARISGGRFAMTVEGLSGAALALHVEGGLAEALRDPVTLGGMELLVSAKVGIALYPADGRAVERLFMNAEAAVQRAKETSEPFVFYAPEINARVAQRLHLETRLRQALERQEFVLHYQPKVDLQTRRIVGVEALIRWLDPARGLIPPLDFIPLLEETGLINEVGRWVVRQACADRASWLAEGLAAPRVAVNVSQAQLRQKDFVASVLGVLGGAQAGAAGIDLEITESLVMVEGSAHLDKLRELRSSGLRIHMDDFGTGYSSLGQIARLPLDTLKVDRTFIAGMSEGSEHLAIVSMIIALAQALKLQVIAEGVETETQATILQLLGCDQGQGWLFSPPVADEALRAMLRIDSPLGYATVSSEFTG